MLEDNQPRPKIFDMPLEFFESITKANGNYETLLYAFIIKTLRVQGVMPELKCCVNCGKKLSDFGYELPNKKKGYAFSVTAGGVICEKCEEIERTDTNTLIYKPSFDIIDTLKYLFNTSLEKFERVKLKSEISEEIRMILSEYIDCYLGINVLREAIDWR